MRFKKSKHPIANKEAIYQINIDSINRLNTIVIILLAIVMFQILSYSKSDNIDYQNLLYAKVALIFGGSVIVIFNTLLKKEFNLLKKHSELIIIIDSIMMILLAAINTFYAQPISSDISIYLFVLFSVVASVRMRPRYTFLVLFTSFIFFAVGLGYYQTNEVYLSMHRMNGGVINVLAYFISLSFYRYAVTDLNDKEVIRSNNIELKILSERDHLTGLYNQRILHSLLKETIQEVRVSKESLYLCVVDLDGFKGINDKYGHAYGDEVLKMVASIMLETLKDAYIVGRYGGDEFLIIYKGKSTLQVYSSMKKLQDLIISTAFKESNISFSCGISKWNNDSEESFFYKADTYMYDAKKAGKNEIIINDVM